MNEIYYLVDSNNSHFPETPVIIIYGDCTNQIYFIGKQGYM